MKKQVSVLAVLFLGIMLLNAAQRTSRENERIQKAPDNQNDQEVRLWAGTGGWIETLSMTEPESSLYVGQAQWMGQVLTPDEKNSLIRVFTIEEQEVYTFLQGPRSWEEGVPWSGEWCQLGVKGNSFGNFGCGLCCMANIYDTLSPYEVSPWDMCEYAMTVSGYAPRRKAGAIDWGNMKETLKTCGIRCDVYYKPDTYEEFQEQMSEAKSAVVLVSSSNDDAYWKDTPGHYVNIWMYEEESDTVFLAEPGSPENNRSRIPLRYVFDALKTTSKYQYLAVEDYSEADNAWKQNGIDETWNRP